MSSKTKIVVIRMKELVYTGIFILLAVVLILLVASMFAPKKQPVSPMQENAKQEALYLVPPF